MPTPQKTRIRVPPHSKEAEEALLGSIMLRPEVMFEIIDVVYPQSFYFEKHRIIFETIFDLFSKRHPTDLLSVAARLKEKSSSSGNKNLLEEIGGNSYLSELVNSVPSAANAEYYATIIQKKHLARNLIGAADYISSLGYDEAQELEELLDQAQKKIYDVTSVGGIHKFSELKDELSEAWERLDRLHHNGDGLRGVPTGFKDLDDKLSGLQKSDLIILAARPSVGKTALALDIARQSAVEYGTAVGIFSLEMSSQQLVDRMLAAQSNVNAWKLRTGRGVSEDDFESIRQSLDVLSKAPIYIDDQPGNNILKMRSVARRLKNEKGLGLIIVDYLQLMMPTKNYDSMVNQVTEISRSLKNLARELEVPVLALSQLSRAIESRGGRPKLSDLRDSGSIEQDADVVAFIHREDKIKHTEEHEKTNIAEILIEKHRNGATGKVELFFNEKKATFQPLEKAEFVGAEADFREF